MLDILQRLLAELKRRRVFRVAGVYAVVAWLAIQVTHTVFPTLDMPEWTLRLVVLLVAIGFPIAIGLAWAFDVTPDGIRRTAAEAAGARAPIPSQTGERMVRRSVWFVLGILVAGSGAWIAVNGRDTAALDTDMIAVLPFRVNGDPQLEYLRGGMLDLLAATLTGEGGPRSSDPRSLMAAWSRAVPSEAEDLPEDAAIDFARGIGAGQVLLGGIVGTPSRFTATAKVLAVPGGRIIAQASVEGSEQELTRLVEQLSVQLLSQLVGAEGADRLSALDGVPLPQLRLYLEGRTAYRSGHMVEAEAHFSEALRMDSTFALAATGLSDVLGWTVGRGRDMRLADEAAFAARDRLSPRDQKLLMARLGPNFPETSTGDEYLRAAEAAVDAAPDSPEAWYQLGEVLLHRRPDTGEESARDLAREALDRAVALDSSFVSPMIHLVELASHDADRERMLRIATAALVHDSTGDIAEYMRWFRARGSGDPEARRRVRERFSIMNASPRQLIRIHARAQPADTLDVNDLELLAPYEYQDATSSQERARAHTSSAHLMVALARPAAAEEFIRRLPAEVDQPIARILAALEAGSDVLGAERAALSLAPIVTGPVPDAGPAFVRWARIAVFYETWELLQGRTATVTQTLESIRRKSVEMPHPVPFLEWGVAQLEAMYAAETGRADALEQARNFAQLLIDQDVHGHFPYIAARLLGQLGDPELGFRVASNTLYASAILERARLGAQIGRRENAIRAYQTYLLLRHNPEPSMQPEIDRVRAELARMTGE